MGSAVEHGEREAAVPGIPMALGCLPCYVVTVGFWSIRPVDGRE
jgi:hypothetical protein